MKTITNKKCVITTIDQIARIYFAVANTQLNNHLSIDDEVKMLLGLFLVTLKPVEMLKTLSFHGFRDIYNCCGHHDDFLSKYNLHLSSRIDNFNPGCHIFLQLANTSSYKLKLLIKDALSRILNDQHAELRDIELFVFNFLCKRDVYTKKFIKQVLSYKKLPNEEFQPAIGLVMLWSTCLQSELESFHKLQINKIRLERFTPIHLLRQAHA